MRKVLVILIASWVCFAGCAENDNTSSSTDTLVGSDAGVDVSADAVESSDVTGDTASAAEDMEGAEDTAEDVRGLPDIDYTSDIDLETYTGTTVSASGNAINFSRDGGRIEGAEVSILEFPGLTTTTDADGGFRFDGLPSGARVSFLLIHPDFPPIQTGTFLLGTEDIEQVTFQAPDHDMYTLMANLTRIRPREDRCQISSTVTRRGLSLYSSGTSHGEPDATVTLEPVDEASGPIYFNLVNHNTIFPDTALEHTSLDGGVLYLNVFPGEYTLTAHKEGTTFTQTTMRCRPGWLVNASPPWGLQATEGGIGPIITP